MCALRHDGSFQLLVATILSAQCTDERVNMVTPGLFAAYPTAEALAEAPLDDVEERIRRRFDPDHAGLGSQDRFQLRQVRGVDGQPGPAVDDGCKPVGASVGVGRHHQMVAGVEQSEDGVFGRHPAGEGEPELCSL